MNQEGVKRFVLEGTDYVYPRTTNKILAAYLKAKASRMRRDRQLHAFRLLRLADEVAKIKTFGSAGKKTAVVSTINGDANVPFYKELGNQGIKATDIPVIAFSVASRTRRPRHQAAGRPSRRLELLRVGRYPINKRFISDWHKYIKDDKRVTNDPMEAAYIGFNAWVKAVQQPVQPTPTRCWIRSSASPSRT